MNETCDISFREKANIFSYEYLQCILFIIGLNDDSYLFTKKLCSKLIITSHIMEDFLDFHGAKKNKDWLFYRAISAAIRHLSLACYSQRHTLDRFDFYNFGEQNHSAFKQEALGMLKFLQDALHQAAPVALREAKRLGITIPESGYDLEYFPGIATAGQQFTFYERYDLETIYKLVPDVINEVTMRSYEMRVHNIQSSFDSYVITTLQSPDAELLNQLRSHFSIVFHILQVLGRLLHFYERHLYNTGFKHVYRNISLSLSDLIDPDAVLDRAMNYCLYYAGRFLSSGKAVATRVLNDNMESGTIEVGIPKDRGFHSRPSLLVAKIVQHYGGEVKLHVGKDQFDASSVLDIQWAGGKIKKEEIETVVFTGDSRALNDLKILSGVNYGEDHMGKGIPLPRELSYLI